MLFDYMYGATDVMENHDTDIKGYRIYNPDMGCRVLTVEDTAKLIEQTGILNAEFNRKDKTEPLKGDSKWANNPLPVEIVQ